MSGFVVHFAAIEKNTYPFRGWAIGIRPGIIAIPPIAQDLKQLPPVGRLVYRAPENETIIARAELTQSRASIIDAQNAQCLVRDARNGAIIITTPATYALGRISAPLTLTQGIYDVSFEIALANGQIITMARPIRLLVGPPNQ